jgi:hypothetical protein
MAPPPGPRNLGCPQGPVRGSGTAPVAARGLPGDLLESKALSVALLYRLAPELQTATRALARQAARQLGAGYRVQAG